MFRLVVRSGIPRQVQFAGNGIFRSEETHCQQNQLCWQCFVAAGNLAGNKLAVFVPGPLNANNLDFFHMAVLVADESLGGDQVLTGIVAKHRRCFFLAIVEAVHFGPLGPGIVRGPFRGWFGQNLELDQAATLMTDRCAHTIRAGITTTNHNDVLALCRDVVAILLLVEQGLGVVMEEFHCEMDSFEVPSFDGKVTRFGCAHCEDHGIALVH